MTITTPPFVLDPLSLLTTRPPATPFRKKVLAQAINTALDQIVPSAFAFIQFTPPTKLVPAWKLLWSDHQGRTGGYCAGDIPEAGTVETVRGVLPAAVAAVFDKLAQASAQVRL